MRRIAGATASVLAVVIVLGLFVGVVGRLASDRWVWSQFLFWVPEEVYLSAAVVLCVLAWPLALLGRSRRRSLRLATLACVVGVAHLGIVHWRLDNWVWGRGPGAVRVMNWNVTAVERDQFVGPTLLAQNADIILMVNPVPTVHWNDIIASFPEPMFKIRDGGFIVLSRYRIVRHGSLTLGIEGARTESFREETRHPDPGQAMFVEVDTSAKLGRTTTIWMVDMPSDWRKSRWEMAGKAAAAIADWMGPTIIQAEDGSLTSTSGAKGFPAPDMIVGDFNSPRGSAAVRRIVGEMTDAYDQAGCGYAATWPGWGYHVPFPVLHLDHIFVSPRLRATRYEILKPVFCYHRPQVVELITRGN